MIEEAYAAWPLAKTEIAVQVNGRPYLSSSVTSMVNQVKSEFTNGPNAKNRADCEKFKTMLPDLVRGVPKDVLATFTER